MNQELEEEYAPLADPAEAYDLVSNRYDSLWNGALAFAENRAVFSRLLDRGLLAGRVLDLGCGTGLLLDWCKEWITPSCYFGIDVSPGMVTEAQRKHPGYNFMPFDLDEQDEGEWRRLQNTMGVRLGHGFDSIVALFAVPSYLRYPDRLAQRMAAWLPQGGSLTLMPFGLAEAGQPDYKLTDAKGRQLGSEGWDRHRVQQTLEGGARMEARFIEPFTSTKFHEAWKHFKSPLTFYKASREYQADQEYMTARDTWSDAMFVLGSAVKR